jgi:hypothetical protein
MPDKFSQHRLLAKFPPLDRSQLLVGFQRFRQQIQVPIRIAFTQSLNAPFQKPDVAQYPIPQSLGDVHKNISFLV